MEAIVLIFGLFAALIVLGMAAVAFGTDSRDLLRNDFRI
jgi:hypothetical protein